MAKTKREDMRPYIVCAVKGTELQGCGPRMNIQRALFEAFAELYGGKAYDGRDMQMLRLSCPEGDPAEARARIFAYVDIYGVGGAQSADAMRDALIAKAKEEGMAGMGISALRSVLDRLCSRYDCVRED